MSSPTQPRSRFQSQKPKSIQFPVAKLNFRKCSSSRKTPAPPHSLPNPAQPVQPQPSPLNRHFQTHPASPIQINLQPQNSTSPRPPAQTPAQPPAPSPAQPSQPSPPHQTQNMVPKKNSVKTFRSKLSVKTFLAPKPLTISINHKP